MWLLRPSSMTNVGLNSNGAAFADNVLVLEKTRLVEPDCVSLVDDPRSFATAASRVLLAGEAGLAFNSESVFGFPLSVTNDSCVGDSLSLSARSSSFSFSEDFSLSISPSDSSLSNTSATVSCTKAGIAGELALDREVSGIGANRGSFWPSESTVFALFCLSSLCLILPYSSSASSASSCSRVSGSSSVGATIGIAFDFLALLPSADASILPKIDWVGSVEDGASTTSADVTGLKTGAAGLNAGPLDVKLNSDLLGVMEDVLLPKPLKPLGLKAGAVGLKAAAVGLKAGASAFKPLPREDLKECCCGGDTDVLEEVPNILFLAVAGVNENAEDEKMPGLNVALGLALGLNSFAATLSRETEDFDEV
jgi:hypothetical protein